MRRSALALLALAVLVALWLLWPEGSGVRAPGGSPAASSAAALPAAANGRHESGSLEGRVLDPAGAPAVDAEVHVFAGEEIAASVHADDAGSWRVGDLPAGDYVLQARRGGFVSQPLGPIPLAAGETLGSLDLDLVASIVLAGTVRDAATGSTIEGARIELQQVGVRSDRAGRFHLGGLVPGHYQLRAGADGYAGRSQSIELVAARTVLEIALQRGAAVHGRVMDGETPVAGAAVLARPYRLAGSASPGAPVITGTDGRFALDVPAGQVEIEATAMDGRRGASAPLDLAPGVVAEEVVIALEVPAQLTGQVVDAAGAPAAHAAVHAATLEGTPLGQTAADGAGRFAFAQLPSGMLRVVARTGTASGVSAPIGLEAGGAAEVSVRLGAGSVEGRVEDAAGHAVGGARISVWAEDTPRSAAITGASAEDGSFLLAGLPDFPLRVEASQGERRAEVRGVHAGGPPLRLVVGGGQLVGLVLVAGRPATDFTIAAAAADPGSAGGATRQIFSADGTFRLQLPPGRYEVRAGAAGGGVATARAEVPGSGDSERVVLEIEGGGTVEGVVMDAESGAPIPGVRLSTAREGVFAFGQAAALPSSPQALSGADGSFRLVGLEAGRRLPIFAWKPGYRPVRPQVVQLADGETHHLNVELAPGDAGESSIAGVGITLGAWRGALVAASVIPGGPGWEAGVRPGDHIVAVDGRAVDIGAMRSVAEQIRGQVGTPVRLDLVRGEQHFRASPLRAELRF